MGIMGPQTKSGLGRTLQWAKRMTVSDYFSDVDAAPLFCAGAIGYRSLNLASIQNGQPLGLTGFGASAHLVLKLARHLFPDTSIYVFARSERERDFARELGAAWSGDIGEKAPEFNP